MQSVEVVICNWKRPRNVEQIIEAYRAQSCPCAVTLIDAAADTRDALLPSAGASADRLIVLRENRGGYNRFAFAFDPLGRYSLLVDDDMLPGRRCIEHFVRTAQQQGDAGLLGQIGRIIGTRYRPADVPRSPQRFTEVDLVVRGYFVRTDCLPDVMRLRVACDGSIREDDMVLAAAIRHLSGRRIMLTPDEGPDTRLNLRELPAPHALSHDPRHLQHRDQFWGTINRIAQEAGALRVGCRSSAIEE